MKKTWITRVMVVVIAIMMITTATACTKSEAPSSVDETKATGESTSESTPEVSTEKSTELDIVPIEIGVLDGVSSVDDENYPTAFLQEVMNTLKIDLTVVGFDEERLNLMLAGGDIFDLMRVNTKHVKQVVEGKLAVNLDDYLDEYGANINKHNVRNDVLRKYFSNGDGNLYFHTPNSGYDNPEAGAELWNGYIVRWDLYKQIGAPAINNNDDYIAALKAMQALYPENENGDPVYGIGVHNDWGLWGWMIRGVSNMGYTNLAHWGYLQSSADNNLISNYLDLNSPFWKEMEFYYKLNKEGLLDPDSFTMKWEDISAKATNGQYLGGYQTWSLGEFYSLNREEDENTTKGFMVVPSEGIYGWYGHNSVCGWADKNLFVSSKSENIERCVMFVDYMDSDEANRLFYSGKEGVHWNYVDSEPKLTKEALELKVAGGDIWGKTGIQDSGWMNIIGYAGMMTHADGHPYNLFDADRSIIADTLNPLQKDFSEFYDVEVPSDVHRNIVAEGKAYDKSIELPNIAACMPNLPDDINTIDGKLDELVTKGIPKLVLAKDDAEFNAARDQLIADLKSAGAEEALEWWQSEWSKGKEFFESLMN